MRCCSSRVAAGRDQAEVVDPGRQAAAPTIGLCAGFGVNVAADRQRDRPPDRPAAEADLELGQIQRIEHQLDPLTGRARASTS